LSKATGGHLLLLSGAKNLGSVMFSTRDPFAALSATPTQGHSSFSPRLDSLCKAFSGTPE
jgi:hypothetical protein